MVLLFTSIYWFLIGYLINKFIIKRRLKANLR
jgi:hypothetical protein